MHSVGNVRGHIESRGTDVARAFNARYRNNPTDSSILPCFARLTNIANHDSEDPAIDGKEEQRSAEQLWEKGAMAKKLQTIGLMEPKGLSSDDGHGSH